MVRLFLCYISFRGFFFFFFIFCVDVDVFSSVWQISHCWLLLFCRFKSFIYSVNSFISIFPFVILNELWPLWRFTSFQLIPLFWCLFVGCFVVFVFNIVIVFVLCFVLFPVPSVKIFQKIVLFACGVNVMYVWTAFSFYLLIISNWAHCRLEYLTQIPYSMLKSILFPGTCSPI